MSNLSVKHQQEQTMHLFFEENLRCENLYPLFMCISDVMPSGLKDVLETELKPCHILGLDDDFIEPLINNWSFSQEVAEKLRENEKTGFLAEFATPIPRNFKTSDGGTSWEDSWGYYRKEWFYADSLTDLQNQAADWAREHFQECKEKELGSQK